jgi:hypothetical protein
MKRLLTLLFLLNKIAGFSQIDYHSIDNQKLTTIRFDTLSERTFVYIKPNARLYFRISDIKQSVDSLYGLSKTKYNKTSDLIDTLNSKQNKIEIIDLGYSYGNDDREKIMRKRKIPNKILKINNEFESIGLDLILNGKFMVYSIRDKKMIFDGLKVVKSDGLYGTEYLDFIFPDKSKFYYMITALGE